MPENKTLDPFKPAQPHIPGVSPGEENRKQPQQSEQVVYTPATMGPPPSIATPSLEKGKLAWVALILAGALAIFVLFVHSRKASPPRNSAQDAAPAPAISAPTPPPSQRPPVEAKLPTGPGPIATVAQLAKPWSAREFYFQDPLTEKSSRAMIVRLPGGALWGFSLREPYGSCDLEYVTDLRKLQQQYDFTATHPMVADPCNKTVFDLTRYGNAPGGLVRGEIAQGSGWRPPLAIEVRTQNDQIIAVRMEQ